MTYKPSKLLLHDSARSHKLLGGQFLIFRGTGAPEITDYQSYVNSLTDPRKRYKRHIL